MKKRPLRITLLGNNSGRNLGDAAILSSILEMLSREIPQAEFLVPSINPQFIDKHYGHKYNVRGVDVRPYTLSLRLLGLPTLLALARSDMALICDGIIFGRKLWSVHNFLITLVFLVPWARLFRCKVVCFSCGIGPFPDKYSDVLARWVLNLCNLVIMREHDSKKLAEEIGVTRPIQVTGDAAFANLISSENRGQKICRSEGIDLSRPILGLNITPYLDGWLEKNERLNDPRSFIDTYAEAVLLAKQEIAASDARQGEIQNVVFSCSPMDEDFSQRLAAKVGGVVIDNTKYLSHDIQAVMRFCDLFVGMRFHSLVLSSAAGAPIVGLVYAPKVRGYFRYLGCPELGIELRTIGAISLGKQIKEAWETRQIIKERQQKVVAALREGALYAATQLREIFFPELPAPELSPQDLGKAEKREDAAETVVKEGKQSLVANI